MSELIERHFSNSPAIIACSGGGYLLLIDGKLIARSSLREMQRVLEPVRPNPWRHAPAIAAIAVAVAGLVSLYLLRSDGAPNRSTAVAAVPTVRAVPLKIYDVVPAPKPRPQE